MRMSILVGENKGGTSGTVDDSGGENAEDAAVPCGIVQNEALGQKISGCAASCGQLSFDRFERLRLGCTALVVEAVQLFRQLGCARCVFCEEQFDDVAGNVHSASGVDARREAKAYFGCCRRTVDWDLCNLHEGSQAGLHW